MAQDLDLQIKIEAISQQAQQALESLSKAFEDLVKQSKGADSAITKSVSTIEKASKSFQNAGKSLQDFGKNVEDAGKKLTTRLTLALTGIGLLAAREFGQAEEESFKLNNALRAFGRNTEGVRNQFAALSEELEKYSRNSAGAITAAAGLATQYTKNNDETENLVRSSVELAAISDGDLQGAIRKLGSTLSGQVGLLARTFPELNNYSEAQLKAGAAVEYFLSRFGGSALESTKTFNGQIIQTRNNINSFLTLIGETLAPYLEKFNNFLNTIVNSLKTMNPELRQQVVIFGALAAALGPFLVALGTIASIVGKAVSGFGLLFSAAQKLSFLFSPQGAIVLGVLALAGALAGSVNLFLKLREAGVSTAEAVGLAFNLLATFLATEYLELMGSGLEKLGKLISFVRPAFGALIKEAGQGLQNISERIGVSFEATKQKINALLAPIGEDAASAFTFGFTKEFEAFLEQFKNLGRAGGKNLGEGFAEGFKEPVFSMYEFLKSQADSIGQTISGNLASSFLDVADGTKSAKQAMEDFARSTLRYIAQIILQQSILNALRAAAPGFFGVSGGGANSAGGGGGGAGAVTAATGGLIKNSKVQRFNGGGPVVGPGGPTSDMVPAWLSNGEFVLKASAVRALGTRFLYGLNQIGSKGGIPAFADGGMVSGGGGTRISIENTGSQKQVASAEQDPTTGIITIFLEDLGKNGPMAKSIQSTFNVRRGGFR